MILNEKCPEVKRIPPQAARATTYRYVKVEGSSLGRALTNSSRNDPLTGSRFYGDPVEQLGALP